MWWAPVSNAVLREVRMLKWLWLSAFVVVLDQLTKWLAETMLVIHEPVPVLAFFNLTLMYNPGAAFSFLADAGGWQRWFFLILSVVVSSILIIWMSRLKRHEIRLAAALALIIGGAIGNLIDRILYGHVIDFIQLYYESWYWPAFNIADSAITVGAVLWIIESFVGAQTSSSERAS
jgi:signal peptidase II